MVSHMGAMHRRLLRAAQHDMSSIVYSPCTVRGCICQNGGRTRAVVWPGMRDGACTRAVDEGETKSGRSREPRVGGKPMAGNCGSWDTFDHSKP